MQIVRVSQMSGKTHTLELNVTPEQMNRFHKGEHVQNVFPHLSRDEREFILTGTTKEEWDIAFPPEEMDDEDKF